MASIENLNLKKFGREISITSGTPSADFYERYCRLAQKYNDEQQEAFTKWVLGVEAGK